MSSLIIDHSNIGTSTGPAVSVLTDKAYGSARALVALVGALRTNNGGMNVTGVGVTDSLSYTEALTARVQRNRSASFFNLAAAYYTTRHTEEDYAMTVAAALSTFTAANFLIELFLLGVDQDDTDSWLGAIASSDVTASSLSISITPTVTGSTLFALAVGRGGDCYPYGGMNGTVLHNTNTGSSATNDISCALQTMTAVNQSAHTFTFTSSASDGHCLIAFEIIPNTIGSQVLSPVLVQATVIVPTPMVAVGPVSVAPGTGVASAVVTTPVVSPGAVAVAPAAATVGATVGAPTVVAVSVTISPATAQAETTVLAASVTTGPIVVTPTAGAAAVSVPSPIVSVENGTQIVQPQPATAVVTVPGPALAAGAVSIAPDAAQTAVSVLVPTVTPVEPGSGDLQTIGADAAVASAVAPVPTVWPLRIEVVFSGPQDAGENTSTGEIYLANTSLNLTDANSMYAVRATGLRIRPLATINDMRLVIQTISYDDPAVTVRTQDSTSPAALTTTPYDISNRSLMPANVTWQASNVGAMATSPNLSALLKQLVDLPAWTPGVSGLVLVLRGIDGAGGWLRGYTGDAGLEYRPRLTINWSAGASALVVGPDSATAAAAALSPTVAPGPLAVTPVAADATVSVPTPVVMAGAATVTPDDADAAVSVPTPVVMAGTATVTPDVAEMTVSVPAPTLVAFGGPQTVTPIAAIAAVSVPSPALAAGPVPVTPASVVAAAAVPAPTVRTEKTVVPAAAVAAVAAAPPAALMPGAVSVVLAAAEMPVSAPSPEVTAGAAAIRPAVATATVSVPAVTVTPGVAVSVPASATAAATVPPPAVVLGPAPQLLVAGSAETAIIVPVPIVAAGAVSVMPSAAVVTALVLVAIIHSAQTPQDRLYRVPMADRLYRAPAREEVQNAEPGDRILKADL